MCEVMGDSVTSANTRRHEKVSCSYRSLALKRTIAQLFCINLLIIGKNICIDQKKLPGQSHFLLPII